MSCSKLWIRDDRKRITEISLPQQFQQASNSPASASIIRTLPAEQCSYALNNKVTRPVPSPTFKDKGNVLGNIGCNQADSRSQFSCSDFTEHFRCASKPGIRISQSPNNSGELPYTESGKKLKDQISSFSSYEKGSTSNSVTQDTCVATDITHNAGLSALLPTNQVYELPHNPSAKTRRSAGRSHSSAKQVKAIKNKKKKKQRFIYLCSCAIFGIQLFNAHVHTVFNFLILSANGFAFVILVGFFHGGCGFSANISICDGLIIFASVTKHLTPQPGAGGFDTPISGLKRSPVIEDFHMDRCKLIHIVSGSIIYSYTLSLKSVDIGISHFVQLLDLSV
ncbi:uncharacterized protein [Coffea arabica]|uniref:Uncharacterized protein n=1 Tax=Coffea arabica TaxID=13443 RepID=A0ABM4VK77_COFAR